MTNKLSVTHVLVVALAVVAVIGVATAGSNYQGEVDLNLTPNGINLKMNGGKEQS